MFEFSIPKRLLAYEQIFHKDPQPVCCVTSHQLEALGSVSPKYSIPTPKYPKIGITQPLYGP